MHNKCKGHIELGLSVFHTASGKPKRSSIKSVSGRLFFMQLELSDISIFMFIH